MTRQELDRCLAQGKLEPPELKALNDRELELVSLMSQGNGGQQIAREMGLDPDQLIKLKARVQKKLGLRDEVELVQFAAKQRFSSRSTPGTSTAAP
jgi:DNA-binding CsgD family transcriptional regulator